jgi:hypothetical protein
VAKLEDDCNLPVHENPFIPRRYQMLDQPVIFLELLLVGFPLANRQKLEDRNDEGDCGSDRADADAR